MQVAVWNATLLGGLTLSDPSGNRASVTRFRTKKSATLLAFLLIEPGKFHSRDYLADLLWPEVDTERGRQSLRQELSTLRRHITPETYANDALIETDGHTSVALRAHVIQTDVGLFEIALRSAAEAQRAGAMEAAHRFLQEAAAVQGSGVLLPAITDSWVLPYRERFARQQNAVLRQLARLEQESGKIASALETLQTAIMIDPADDRARMEFVTYLCADGQHTAARAHLTTWERLAEEGECDPPSAALRQRVASLPLTDALPPPSPVLFVRPEVHIDSESRATPSDTRAYVDVAAPAIPAMSAIPPAPTEQASEQATVLSASPRARLPLTLTSFHGRASEIMSLTYLLWQNEDPHARLATITGFGGVGKTRLAIETLRRIVNEHDRVEGPDLRFIGWVDFISIEDDEDFTEWVLQKIDRRSRPRDKTLPALDTILAMFASIKADRLLLILDNTEHVVGTSAELLMELLTEEPRLSVLVTSRQALGIPGERELPLSPLPLPEGISDTDIEALEQNCSVALFVDRARAARAGFALTERTAPDVVAICNLLEGIPLAIELAAAQLATQSISELRADLEADYLGPLAAPRTANAHQRHQTMRGVLHWSIDLLPQETRDLLPLLSVFRGAFTVEEADQVCGFPVREHLVELKRHSLMESVSGTTTDVIRFRLLNPTREVAASLCSPDDLHAATQRYGGFK